MTYSGAPVLECVHLKKVYTEGPRAVEVLTDINLQVFPGERIAIVGSSGSGKTTLLNLLGGLDVPTAGEVIVAGRNAALLNETERGELRNRYLGFVYQFHHLLSEFDACENVAMPLLIAGTTRKVALARAAELLARVNLEHRLDHLPSALSGGERQRVAIARALVTEPTVILADEPTGNLDEGNANQVHKLMLSLAEESGTALVVVTHDQQFAERMQTIQRLQGGSLVS